MLCEEFGEIIGIFSSPQKAKDWAESDKRWKDYVEKLFVYVCALDDEIDHMDTIKLTDIKGD